MDAFSIQTVGLKELDAKLAALGDVEAKRIIRDGLRAGGAVFRDAVAAAAPERPVLPSGTALPPGALRQDIEVHFGRSDEGLPAAIIGPGKYTAHAAGWVEYGHRLVRGGTLSMKRGKLQGSGHQIGEVPAHPFVRPAYESSARAAVDAVIKVIVTEVEAAAAK